MRVGIPSKFVAAAVVCAGTPLWWLAGYGLGPADEGTDGDGDGFTAAEEYRARTDPTRAASRLVLRQISASPWILELPADPNRVYRLYGAPHMQGPWDLRGGPWPGDDSGALAIPVPVDADRPAAFYRAGADLPE